MPKMSWVFLYVLLLACSKEDDVMPVNPANPSPVPTPQPKNMKYLALGDSYTIGQSVDVDERWPVQLATKLEADGLITQEELKIIAVTGWTTQNLLNGIAQEQPNDTYDLVSLLIGVNNFYQGRSLAEYEKQFVQLLDSAVKFAQGKKENVFVVSIPDYAYTPFGNGNQNISDGIDQFNASNKRLTDSVGIAYIDITPISRRGLDEPDLVASDNLHPSGKQYSLWVEEMYATIKQKVQ